MAPAWSPSIDVQVIAFASNRYRESFKIYVMDADGSNEPVRLSDSPGIDSFPDWSPGASQIVFHSNRSGLYEIYKMDYSPDTTGSNEPVSLTPILGGYFPNWSSDGNNIAFAAGPIGNRDIYFIDHNGLNPPTPLTSDPEHDDVDPAWSPGPTQ